MESRKTAKTTTFSTTLLQWIPLMHIISVDIMSVLFENFSSLLFKQLQDTTHSWLLNLIIKIYIWAQHHQFQIRFHMKILRSCYILFCNVATSFNSTSSYNYMKIRFSCIRSKRFVIQTEQIKKFRDKYIEKKKELL